MRGTAKFIFSVIMVFSICGMVFGAGLSSTAKKIRSSGFKYIASQQNPDGSYGKGDNIVNKTAIVIYALASSQRKYRPEDTPSVSKAVDYLLKQQKEDGSFGDLITTMNSKAALMALEKADYKGAVEKADTWLKKNNGKNTVLGRQFFGISVPGYQLFDNSVKAVTVLDGKLSGKILEELTLMQQQESQDPKIYGKVKPVGEGLFADSVVTTALATIAADRILANSKKMK